MVTFHNKVSLKRLPPGKAVELRLTEAVAGITSAEQSIRIVSAVEELARKLNEPSNKRGFAGTGKPISTAKMKLDSALEDAGISPARRKAVFVRLEAAYNETMGISASRKR